MRMLLASCILASSAAPAISAQYKPDFSGDWILVNSINGASNAAQTMTVRESFKRESVKAAPIDPPLITLAVERRLNSGVHSELYTIATEGGIVGGVVGNTGTQLSGQSQQTGFSTTWDGDKLVIDIRYSGRPVAVGAESEHKEVWSLDPQGALLLTITDRYPGTEPTTTNLTYRRRP
jgi:hypothetical protein